MSACTSTCRPCTGKRFEHCKVCHRTLSGASLGDGHRVLVGTFVIAKPTLKSKASTAQHFASEELVPKGWVTQSVGNIRKRCITDEELAERGWRVVKGVVRGPQWDDNPWTKKDELAEEVESVLDAEVRRMDDDLLLLDELLPEEAGEDSERPVPRLDALDELLLDDLLPVAEPVQLELEYGGMELVRPGLIEPTPEPEPEVDSKKPSLDDFLADWDADTGIIGA